MEYVSAAQAISAKTTNAFKALPAVPTNKETAKEFAVANKATKTTMESAHNVHKELSGAQPPNNASMSADKTQPSVKPWENVNAMKDTD